MVHEAQMRPLSPLYRLGHLVFAMSCLVYSTLSPLFGWIWRWFRPWFLRVTACIVKYTRLALGWTKDTGRRTDRFEISDDDDDPPAKSPKVVVGLSTDQQDQQWPTGENYHGNVTNPVQRDEGGDGDEDDDEDFVVETTDELYCCYDSTWETEETQESVHRSRRSHRKPAASGRHYKFSRFETAAKDMQNYRHNYPTRPQDGMRVSNGEPNLNFYLGHRPSVPDGVHIDTFHNKWFGDYRRLEYGHSYIQWLFPLQEPGMNYEASTLTKEEVQGFLKSSTAKENLLKSYKLMLDFYGIELCDEKTGEVRRAANWRDRFDNLNAHTHNNLRITRILKCQGNLGYAHYQAPLVHFFLTETLVNGELQSVKDSVLNYFVFAVLNKKERKHLLKYAYMNYDRKDEFVWCPKKIQRMWSKQSSHQN